MNVEQLKNGKYKYREKYKDPITGKWKSVTVTYEKYNRHIEKLAQKELNSKIDNILNKGISPTTKLTFSQLANLYLTSAKDYLKFDSTFVVRSRLVGKVVRLIGENTLVSNLTPTYINGRMENDSNKTTIKIILSWAYQNELIERDLARFIKRDVKKRKTLDEIISDQDNKEYYEREELAEIFNTLSNNKDFNSQMLRLILETQTLLGKRWSEITALSDDDIDEDRQIVHIYKRSFNGSINTPKTEKTIDDLGINRRVIQIKKEALFLKHIYSINSDFLFCNKYGKPYIMQTARYILTKNNFNPKTHIFRKTCASLLAEQGVPLHYIQARLGHEDDKTTRNIYIKVTSKMKKQEQDYFKTLDIL